MFLRLSLVGVFLVAVMSTQPLSLSAQEAAAPGTARDPIGYFLGISMGQQMSQSGFKLGDFDLDAFKAGFSDALSGKEPSMSSEQLKATQGKIEALLQQRQAELRVAMEKVAVSKKAEGAKWLAANAKKEGVKSLEKGLQYKVLKAGSGPSPAATDTVRVHYTGKLTDGKVFDSSIERGEPVEFAVGRVIPGWTMALQKMKVGDKWMIYIPSDLAYGERGSQGAIGPNEVLVFEIELLGVL
jgi:FKBP-type peptidyl-prolyl cis-trans isomerase